MRFQACVLLLVCFLGVVTLEFVFATEAAYADQAQQQWSETTHKLDQMGPHLLKYFVLSMFLEIVLTLVFKAEQVFTWLQGKTWKTPLALVFGLLAAWYLQLDIMNDVLSALDSCGDLCKKDMSGTEQSVNQPIGIAVTGVLLAGGNHSFYRIFAKLGIHDRFEGLVRAAA